MIPEKYHTYNLRFPLTLSLTSAHEHTLTHMQTDTYTHIDKFGGIANSQSVKEYSITHRKNTKIHIHIRIHKLLLSARYLLTTKRKTTLHVLLKLQSHLFLHSVFQGKVEEE